MNRSELRSLLAALDLSHRPAEQPIRTRMLQLLDSTPDCFFRSSFPAHFTGSALVVNAGGDQALLHHHRKLDKWLQFGGHCDGDEDVLRVARRETLEESGIEGLILASQHPFDLDIHTIPPKDNEPEHFHFDVRYLFIAPENAQFVVSQESHELRWFTPEELARVEMDEGLRRMISKWESLRDRRRACSPQIG